jgi:hypothetical protein
MLEKLLLIAEVMLLSFTASLIHGHLLEFTKQVLHLLRQLLIQLFLLILCCLLILDNLGLRLNEDLLLGEVLISFLGLCQELLKFNTKLLEQTLILLDHIILFHLNDGVC